MNTKETLAPNQFEVVPLIHSDIEKLEPILRQHVRDSDTGELIEEEVLAIIRYMNGDKDNEGRERRFLVAKDNTGEVIGCMGYSSPEHEMRVHFSTNGEESVEIVNAFVDSNVFRGQGVGKRLFDGVLHMARSTGKKQIVVNSGPRYEKSWGFYDNVMGTDGDMMINHYGEGRHAKAWIKTLDN